MEFDSVADLSETEARDALLQFVAENCCFGSGCAQDSVLSSIQPSTALHYIFETFMEDRSTSREHVPYDGGMVDGPQYGMPPGPWQMQIEPDGLFQDHVKLAEVPHTSEVRPCHRCHAKGYVRCNRCHGSGRNRCNSCGGDGRVWRSDHEGHRHQECCYSCGGDGRVRCHTCGGDGRVTCPTCRGHCQLRWFIQLTVKFMNNTSDYIHEKTDMPDELVRGVSGIKIFEQTMYQVWPISCYKIAEINSNSQAIADAHRTTFINAGQQKLLQQRHTLRGIPVTEITYTWKEIARRFWAYGHERKVHAPDYPQTCCWGCQIL